jgi:threonyl-tRNA synthetase
MFGFEYYVELSTRPDDSMGSDEDWELATDGLRNALESLGLDYIVNEGDGAFYGPKIDFHLRDCLGRTWQCGTIQLDVNLPHRFNCYYIDQNGEKVMPVMLHRVVFGSIERFIGIITENFGGAFPTFLAPVQVNLLPVNGEVHGEYAKKLCDILSSEGIRCEISGDNEKLGYRMRQSIVKKIPFTLVLGDKEMANNEVTYRVYGQEKQITVSFEEFKKMVHHSIETYARY